MINQKILNKIKKLLSLSSSPNVNEANLALERARELMSEYGVSLIEDKCWTASWLETIIESSYTYTSDNQHLQQAIISISAIIADLFSCAIIIREHVPYFVGFSTNVEVCKHAMDCILFSLLYDYKKLRQENRSITFSISFWQGSIEGLRSKFSRAEQSGVGLVVYDKVKDYMKKYTGTYIVKRDRTTGTDGRAAGFAAGQSAQIRPGIKSTNTGKLLS